MDQLQISIEKKKERAKLDSEDPESDFSSHGPKNKGGALIIIIIFPLASSPHQMHSYLDRDICQSKNKAILVIYSLHPPHRSLSL